MINNFEKSICKIIEELKTESGHEIPGNYLYFIKNKLRMAMDDGSNSNILNDSYYLIFKYRSKISLMFTDFNIDEKYYVISVEFDATDCQLTCRCIKGFIDYIHISKDENDETKSFLSVNISAQQDDITFNGLAKKEKIFAFFNTPYHQ